MAHYAILENYYNKVIEVFVGKDEGEDGIDWEKHYSDHLGKVVKRTSYNTRANVHLSGGTPFRKNYAGKGYTYDYMRDAFLPPKPYPSWILDENTGQWVAPIPMPPTDQYDWDEQNQIWIPVTNGIS